MREQELMQRIQVALSQEGALAFRHNVGKAWAGDEYLWLPDGELLIRNPRPFSTGLPPGFPDLQAFLPPNGQAVLLEVKTEGGRESTAQKRFAETVRKKGVNVFTVRSVEEALERCRNAHR